MAPFRGRIVILLPRVFSASREKTFDAFNSTTPIAPEQAGVSAVRATPAKLYMTA